jgi:hypothetical protein
MAEPEDIKPEETATPETEEPEVVAHSDQDELDDWCVFNNSAL